MDEGTVVYTTKHLIVSQRRWDLGMGYLLHSQIWFQGLDMTEFDPFPILSELGGAAVPTIEVDPPT